MHVEVFSIGFGPAIATWRDRVGTVWKLAWLPLGGYVKLHGQERPGGRRRDRTVPGASLDPRPHLPRKVGRLARHRGRRRTDRQFPAGDGAVRRCCSRPPAGRSSCRWPATCCPDSAAAHAGLQADDRIVSIAGTPIASFEDIQRIITAHPAETLPITITRGGADAGRCRCSTDAHEVGGRKVGMLGIRGGQVDYQRLSPAARRWSAA